MIARLRALFAGNKYRLFIFGILALASLACIGLFRWRASLTGSENYAFLVWNLFLAWIPFIVAYFTYTTSLRPTRMRVLVPLAAFVWLIFFPNAPYLLTDFQHLAVVDWQDIDTWYDVLMLLWFAFTGLLLGLVSLFMMQEIIRREFGRWSGWGFVALVTALTAAGVYVGRFLRWNSWDLLMRPQELAQVTLAGAQNMSLRPPIFTAIFAALILFLYLTLYAFGHLLQERQEQASHSGE
jgi:uncharacterized membrane protein